MALIDKASLLMVPSTYEDGTLYNVLPSGNKAPDSTDQNNGYDQTRADFTFDRGNNLAATRIDENGLIQKGRENLILQSNQFDTTWTNVSTTETGGQSGYDGTNNAWKITKSAASGRIQQGTFSAGVYSFSVYVKADTNNWVQLYLDSTTATDPNCFFDLENGTIGTGTNNIDAEIVSVGDGWYRCSVIGNVGTTFSAIIFPAEADSDKSASSGSIFIQNAQLEKGLVATEVMTSGSTTAKAGVLEDMPRINYDANGENGALLLEGLRSNLIDQSEYFGAWTFGSGITLTHNHTTSPEGVQNATLLARTTSGNVQQTKSVTSGTTYAISVFAKAGTSSIVRLIATGLFPATEVNYDLSDESISVETGSVIDSDIEDYGNGWYRCWFTLAPTSTGNGQVRINTGDNVNIILYGAQLEASASYPSSYIPTHGSAVSRSADSCSVTGVSDVIGQTEGTLFWEVDFGANDSGEYPAVFLYDGTSNNRILIQRRGNNSLLQYQINAGGANQVDEFSTTAVGSGKVKIAIAYKANDFVLYLNGTQEASDTSGSTFSGALSQVSFENSRHDKTSQLVLFNERLSNSELATLTTL